MKLKTKEENFRYTSQKDWDQYYDSYKPEIVNQVPFSDIFDKYFINGENKSVLEIGCAGGRNLCYLVKKLKYTPYGIDYSDEIEKTRELFKYNNLPEPVLYKEDFFQWHPENKFDVVCSFGFVEHFENLEDIIKRHVDLVASGGKLLITMPHFAHCQYFLHWLIDRENLKKHNTKIMNLVSIRKAFANFPFEIEHLGYYKTIGFWTERKSLKPWEKVVFFLIRKFEKLTNVVFGYDTPNPLFSPEIVCIAKKYNV